MFTQEKTSRFLIVQNLKIHFHDTEESKPVLVLLHGGGPGAGAWGNFKNNIQYLSEYFRVLAIDLPHFGKSEKPKDRYLDTNWYAGFVSDLLDQLNIENAHFIGNSMGGSVALELALSQPEKVNRLVLMGTAGSLAMFSPLPTEGAKHLINYYKGSGPSKEKIEAFIRSMIFDQTLITPEFLEERYQASIHPDLLVERNISADGMFTLWREVNKIKNKTLLVYGRDDRVVPWDTGLLLLRLMPNADLHVLSKSGHWAQWERSEDFNHLVQAFLLSS